MSPQDGPGPRKQALGRFHYGCVLTRTVWYLQKNLSPTHIVFGVIRFEGQMIKRRWNHLHWLSCLGNRFLNVTVSGTQRKATLRPAASHTGEPGGRVEVTITGSESPPGEQRAAPPSRQALLDAERPRCPGS